MKAATSNAHAAHPILREGVRRDLHRDGRHAAVAHDGEQAMEVGCLGRRTGERHRFAGDARAGGADHTRHPAGRPEDRLQQVGRRRLAVRAGDADRRERVGGAAEHHRRHRAHRPAHGRHQYLRGVQVEPPLHHEGDGPPLEGGSRVVVPVGDGPADAEEQGAGLDLAVVEGGVADEDAVALADLGGVGRRGDRGERDRGEAASNGTELTRAPGSGRPAVISGPGRRAAARPDRPGVMPSRWIEYCATCWNSGAAATPP